MRPPGASPSDAPSDRVRRRALLVSAAAVPVALAGVRLAQVVSDGLAALAASARPSAMGSSASRCAACGARDHTMLDPGCPLAPAVRDRTDA